MCADERKHARDFRNLCPSVRRNTATCLPEEKIMNNVKRIAATAAVLAATLGLSACAGMSNQDRNTAVGAGVGAVAGSVLTGGSAVGAVGGAAVGGVIGNQVQKPPR
jgi:osmotically inducible lipoprotein OsmB